MGTAPIGDLTNVILSIFSFFAAILYYRLKYKDQKEEFERRVKEEEEALRRKYELKENDLIIMDQNGNIIDIRE